MQASGICVYKKFFQKDKKKHIIYQNHLPRGVLRKRCSENMQQIYRRTPKATLLKSHFGMGVLL